MQNFEKTDPMALRDNVFHMIGHEWMLISAADPDTGRPNTMTASWGTLGVLWGKPVCTCFIRPQRFTYPIACRTERLSFAFLPETYQNALKYCGTHSGREGDKFAAAGLTVAYAEAPAAGCPSVPYPAEARLVLIGRKLYEDDLKVNGFLDPTLLEQYKSHDYHRMFICEIEEALVRRV